MPPLPNPRRIACFRTDRIGDLLLAMPAMAALGRAFPQARLTAVVAPRTRELVEGQEWAGDILEWESNWPAFRLARLLKEREIDTAVFFHPRFRLALAAALASIPVRIGTSYRWYSFLFNRRISVHRSRNERHELEYNLDLLKPFGLSLPADTVMVPPVVTGEAKGNAEKLVEALKLPQGFVVVHPGSLGSALNASPQWYGKLARLLEDGGVSVAFTGTEGERGLAVRVAESGGLPAARFVVPGSLKELAAFLSLSRGFVGPSTGPLHLAASLGIPSVGIYPAVQSQSPVRWGPRGARCAVVKAGNAGMDAVNQAEVAGALKRVMSL